MTRKQILAVALSGLVVLAAIGYLSSLRSERRAPEEPPVKLRYGIPYEQYEVVDMEVGNGATLSSMLGNEGVSPQRIDRLARTPNPVFKPGNIVVGQPYHLYFTADSLRTLQYMVYQQSRINFLVFDLRGDSIAVSQFQKEVRIDRVRRTGRIESSLWNAMIDGGMSPGLAAELSEIYAWSIDFFAVYKGDEFTVVYDEQYVDDTISIGTGRIWGAIFNHSGKDYWAIPFIQNDRLAYWDESGNSLRKNLLKAPLRYSRISSRFTNARRHPITRVVRAHHAVDYAAPSGTPVQAVADGVITRCGWGGGGGNTIYIKHARNLQSGYLHLRAFAKGMRVGRRVSQGEVIGYVGSTGLSTGPHLDFRIWKNGTPIDPLKVPTEPAEPIAAANKARFEIVRQSIMAEVMGQLADSTMRITDFDSLPTHAADTAQHP